MRDVLREYTRVRAPAAHEKSANQMQEERHSVAHPFKPVACFGNNFTGQNPSKKLCNFWISHALTVPLPLARSRFSFRHLPSKTHAKTAEKHQNASSPPFCHTNQGTRTIAPAASTHPSGFRRQHFCALPLGTYPFRKLPKKERFRESLLAFDT